MENTLENAMSFIKSRPHYKAVIADPIIVDQAAKDLFAYAASVSPKLVLPERMKISRGDSSHVVAIVKAWNGCYDEFIRLNPSILK